MESGLFLWGRIFVDTRRGVHLYFCPGFAGEFHPFAIFPCPCLCEKTHGVQEVDYG